MAYQTQVFSGGGRVFVATKHIPTKLHTQVVIDGTIIDISEYQIMNNSLVLNEETEKDVVLRISDNPNEFDDIVIQTTTDAIWGEIVGDVESQEDLITFLQDNYEIKTNIKNGINAPFPRDYVTISFDDTTRTLTVVPVSIEGYSFCSNNIEHTITETLTRQISNTQGMYYIYFDGDGILQTTNNFIPDLLLKYALVSIGYWSVTLQKALPNYEFHTSEVSGLWHYLIHRSVGAKYDSGLIIDDNSSGDGTSNDDIRVHITSGYIQDEDLLNPINSKTTELNLTLLYKDGSDWLWSDQLDSVYSITNIPKYNLDTAGVWSQESMTNGYFGVAIFFAYPSLKYEQIVCIMSQGQYATIAEASEACRQRPDINGMPVPEFRALYAKPYKYDSTYTNDSRCAFVPLDDGNDHIDWRYTVGIESAGGGSLGTLSSSDITDTNTYSDFTPVSATQKGANRGIDNALGVIKKTLINKIPIYFKRYLPLEGTTTATGYGLATSYSGTATAKTPAVTNAYTRMPNTMEFLQATASATTVAYVWGTVVTGVFLEDGQETKFSVTAGVATGASNASHRFALGVTQALITTNVGPSTQTNCILLGYDATDTTVQIMHNDNSGVCTKIDTGWAKPSVDRTNVFTFQVWTNDNGWLWWYKATNWETGETIFDAIGGTDVPNATGQFIAGAYISAGTVSAVKGLGIGSIGIEGYVL